MYTIHVETQSDPTDTQFVADQLEVYNLQQTRVEQQVQPLNLFIRDESGAIVGGLLSVTCWGWLSISILWISDALRGQGYGTRLLHQAEAIAVERGCHHANLDTMSFQALPFYLKHGYQVYGTLEDFPIGHKRYFIYRALLPSLPSA